MLKELSVVLGALVWTIVPASAALLDRGNGLIFDDSLRITWEQDGALSARLNLGLTTNINPNGTMVRRFVDTWIEALNAANYKGYSDWRLPSVSPVNGAAFDVTRSYDGSTDVGYNISAPGGASPGTTASELAHLFFVTLGNRAAVDASGDAQVGQGLANVGPFINVQGGGYWAGSEYTPAPEFGWMVHFHSGRQDLEQTATPLWVWPVRAGDVAPVPEPAPVALGPAGGALIVWRLRSNHRRTIARSQ